MTKMVLSLALLISLIGSLAAAAAPNEVLGFRSWKNQRVEDARMTLERAHNEATPDRSVPSERPVALVKPGQAAKDALKDPQTVRVQKGGKGENRLQQAQINFEFATELTINDYFVLYLSQMNSETAILEAAKKMSAEEVAELMLAYKKQLEIGRSSVGMMPAKSASTRL